MNIREIARKVGGEKLVEKIDLEREVQGEGVKLLMNLMDNMAEKYAPEGTEQEKELFVAAGMAEALSWTYAVSVYIIGKLNKVSPDGQSELIATAVRSLTKNLDLVQESVGLKEAGIADKIVAAAKSNGGKGNE